MSESSIAKLAQSTTARPNLTTKPYKYLGFAFLLAWHYCLWFVPQVFPHVPLLESSVTYSWLINLTATVCALFFIAKVLGRKKHLSETRWLYIAAPLLTCAGTLFFLLVPLSFNNTLVAYGLAVFMGITEAVMWILWGEHYGSIKAKFSIKHIGTIFGLTLIVTIIISMVLPPYISSLFVAILPIVSGALLFSAARNKQSRYPHLLPKATAKAGFKSLVAVSIIGFVASIACYFLAAIIPWEELPMLEESFTYGIIGGAVLMLFISAICTIASKLTNIFKLLPWLLVVEIMAFVLFVIAEDYYLPSFILALAISSIFEILLIMYFGILTSKGYVPPAWAFASSCGCIRAGILVGNSLAITYESFPTFAKIATPETCLVFIGILMILLIFLVKQEFSIATLTSDPVKADELKVICQDISYEFSLSDREGEILFLISAGHRTESIAKKLVISPHTVNTHIRHIYEKTQINKRSELLNYINMHRSDY